MCQRPPWMLGVQLTQPSEQAEPLLHGHFHLGCVYCSTCCIRGTPRHHVNSDTHNGVGGSAGTTHAVVHFIVLRPYAELLPPLQ